MKHIDVFALDLGADPYAGTYMKHEVVQVRFAQADGSIVSREGLNHYAVGDAIIHGSTADQWSVSREQFVRKYAPHEGQAMGVDGAYVSRPIPVLAKQMDVAFTLNRRAGGDLLLGKAGDWMLQYAAGEFGVVDAARFASVYRTHAAHA